MIDQVLRRHVVFVVLRAEVARREPRVRHLVVTGDIEAD